MTAFFALAGALVVGASDFAGGLAARSTSPLRVTAWVQAASLALLLAAVWFFAAPAVTRTDLVAGVIAGLSGTFSFAALYASFSRGQISRLAPLAAIIGAAVPAIVSWIRGEAISVLQLIGVIVALTAVVFVSQERTAEDEPSDTPLSALGLAILAGLGFSIFFLALAETSESAGLWPLVAARVVSVPVVAAVAGIVSGGLSMPSRQSVRLVVFAGFAEAISNVFVLLAFQRGPIAVAAVLGAFYPLSTVALARIVLDERLQRIQWVGVGLALVAIPLIALPA